MTNRALEHDALNFYSLFFVIYLLVLLDFPIKECHFQLGIIARQLCTCSRGVPHDQFGC